MWNIRGVDGSSVPASAQQMLRLLEVNCSPQLGWPVTCQWGTTASSPAIRQAHRIGSNLSTKRSVSVNVKH